MEKKLVLNCLFQVKSEERAIAAVQPKPVATASGASGVAPLQRVVSNRPGSYKCHLCPNKFLVSKTVR